MGAPMTEPVQDYVILGVPEGATLEDEDAADVLEQMAYRAVIGQYKGRTPKALLFTETHWKITSDWREVEQFQPAHQCPTCIAGNDQAQAFLKEHPEKRLALGNLTYVEIW
jgi:hypothetical protein